MNNPHAYKLYQILYKTYGQVFLAPTENGWHFQVMTKGAFNALTLPWDMGVEHIAEAEKFFAGKEEPKKNEQEEKPKAKPKPRRKRTSGK